MQLSNCGLDFKWRGTFLTIDVLYGKSSSWTGASPFQREMERILIPSEEPGLIFRKVIEVPFMHFHLQGKVQKHLFFLLLFWEESPKTSSYINNDILMSFQKKKKLINDATEKQLTKTKSVSSGLLASI